MKINGWARLGVVFVLGWWAFGLWELLDRGSPPMFWPAGQMDQWRIDWANWMASNASAILFNAIQPLLMLLAAAVVLGLLRWVVKGFAPESRDQG